jgi:hypothetical protein
VWNRDARRILELDTEMAVNRRRWRQQELANKARQKADRATSFWSLVYGMLMDDTNGEHRDSIERTAANNNTGWFGTGRGRNRKRVNLGNGWEAEPKKPSNS